jgi:hypothetical protein
MKFTGIENGADCFCLDGAAEDTASAYLHYIDSPSAKSRDFASKWERYEKNKPEGLPNKNNCEEVCGWKGVSVNKIDGYDEAEVYRVYTEPYRYASAKERSKRRILKFNIGTDIGIVKHTPNETHESHHDLFKCDAFDVANIVAIEVSEIEFE